MCRLSSSRPSGFATGNCKDPARQASTDAAHQQQVGIIRKLGVQADLWRLPAVHPDMAGAWKARALPYPRKVTTLQEGDAPKRPHRHIPTGDPQHQGHGHDSPSDLL